MTPVENTENLFSEQVTIATGTNAASLPTEGRALVGVQMPSAWTAANLGFEVSFDGGATWVTAYDNTGNLLQAVVSTSRYVAFPVDSAIFAPLLKVKSVTAANVATNQGGARTLTLVFRRLFGGL